MSLATQDMMSTFKSPKWIQSSQWACRPTETYTDSWFLVRTLDPPPLSKKNQHIQNMMEFVYLLYFGRKFELSYASSLIRNP